MIRSRNGGGRTLVKGASNGVGNEVERLILAEAWQDARALIRKALRRESDSHWLWTRLSLTYYEQFQYGKALKYAQRALEIAPRCPLALWDAAGSLEMLGEVRAALAIYRGLIRHGPRAIASGECGEGMASARGLVADCYYRAAGCYSTLGRRKAARTMLDNHFAMRGPGCRSIYPMSLARARRVALSAV